MTTLAFRIKSILNRLGTGKKKNADWARIEEPDTLLRGVFLSVAVLVITGLFSALAMNFLVSPDDALIRFALFLKGYGNNFSTTYANFSIALITLINLTLLVIFIVLGHSDEDDVIEMISDLDAAFNERLSEMEHVIVNRIDDLNIFLIDNVTVTGNAALVDDEEELENEKAQP